ncbi:MAG: galactokinase [Bacteroidetes bacterium]|nr:galactokinase [Bacteroidota bacterium]
MDTVQLETMFANLYGNSETRVFFAPGRVNLIGEHTDYNGGYVLPCALSFGTTLILRKNKLNRIRLATTNFDFRADLPWAEIGDKVGNEWINYPLGVLLQFKQRGFNIGGVDMLFSGNIPNGAGLSSSASIEMVTAIAIDDLLDIKMDRVELIKLCRAAENQFVGMNCGIMDQFAVGMGHKNSALFLNCRSLEYKIIPMNIGGFSLVIANTNKRRELAASKYNERVSECSTALKVLRQVKPMADLTDMSIAEFSGLEYLFEDTTIFKRAKHVISENDRVLQAVSALSSGNLTLFGELMNQSHISLRDDYEVTGFELDSIVSAAWNTKGVLGARMTGAGFGGCSVNLVKDSVVQDFISNVASAYNSLTGLTAEFYNASLGDAAGKVD